MCIVPVCERHEYKFNVMTRFIREFGCMLQFGFFVVVIFIPNRCGYFGGLAEMYATIFGLPKRESATDSNFQYIY